MLIGFVHLLICMNEGIMIIKDLNLLINLNDAKEKNYINFNYTQPKF